MDGHHFVGGGAIRFRVARVFVLVLVGVHGRSPMISPLRVAYWNYIGFFCREIKHEGEIYGSQGKNEIRFRGCAIDASLIIHGLKDPYLYARRA